MKQSILSLFMIVFANVVFAEQGQPITGTASVLSSSGRTTCDYVQLWENGPLWATFNVGATITDYADLQEGADATPYYNNNENAPLYNTNNVGGLYPWNNPNQNGRKSRYNENVSVGIADIATTIWGEGWQTPSKQHFDTLINTAYTTWTWCNGTTVQYTEGCTLSGYKVTGVGDFADVSIFLPAVGYYDWCRSMVVNAGGHADYHTSTISTWGGNYSYYHYFRGNMVRIYFQETNNFGRAIRAIYVPTVSTNPTGIDATSVEENKGKVIKIFKNGSIYIKQGNKTYSIQGQAVKIE